ncbi:MAG TPA: arsenate reductase family protein [Sphingobium sp.]
MQATIWHNPACGTSRKTLAILEETPGVEVIVIQYLKQPYEREKLAQIIRDSGLSVKDAIRTRGTDAEEKGLPGLSDDAILDAMVANPAYVTRPFVETDKGVRYCRPQELVREIL